MTKHIIDKSHATGPGRLRHYTRQERESAMHPAVAKLLSRPSGRSSAEGRRLIEFTRIERGRSA